MTFRLNKKEKSELTFVVVRSLSASVDCNNSQGFVNDVRCKCLHRFCLQKNVIKTPIVTLNANVSIVEIITTRIISRVKIVSCSVEYSFA